MALTLRCLRCTRSFPLTLDAYLCSDCGGGGGADDAGILDVEYPPEAYKELRRRVEAGCGRADVFRWEPLLPVGGAGALTLRAGGTPLVAAPRLAAMTGVGDLLLKNETRNPTASLKDRATAVAVAIGAQLGYTDFYCASAGNAAISLAGFCANLGLGCHVFVPARTPEARLTALRAFGADLTVHPGDYDEAFAESERVGQENGWYSRNCAYNPLLVEGKKTAAFEIAEQLEWDVPDVVVAPVGDGCTLGAIGKGFRQLVDAGLTARVPRLVGVQVPAYDSVVRRFHGDTGSTAPGGDTRAVSIAVRRPRNVRRVLAEVSASGGTVVRADEGAVHEARQTLALRAGVDCEFTSAATLAAVIEHSDELDVRGKRVVLVLTGGRVDGS